MAAPSLAQQVVLVTGATAGIGEAVAQMAAQAGAKLVLAARREGVLQTMQDIFTKQGIEVLTVPTDMADPAQVEALAQTALDHFGRVDILVNNAGYGQMGPIEEIPIEAVQHQFAVNVFGLLGLTRALLPSMRQQGQGRILNISSVAGQISMPLSGVYNASKHAVEALSDALRVEVAPFGIRVIVVEPGPVKTDFFRVAEATAAQVANPNGPYAPLAETMENFKTSATDLAWPVDKVARIILKAMTDPNPAPRYTAFSLGKPGLGLMRLTPTWVMDGFWARTFGFDKIATAQSSKG